MRDWFGQTRAVSSSGKRRARLFRPVVEGLEDRYLMTATLDPINQVTPNVPVGKTIFIPVTGTSSTNSAINYSVSSNNGNVTATIHPGTTYLDLKVTSPAPNNISGDMIFQLFGDLTPQTVQTISGLVNQGFYNGLIFHRVVPNFVIQGGDPNGNGSGGPGFVFNDEFNPQAIFTGNGQLAMANSGKDTNGSQFFVTVGPQRALDFNH